MTLCDIVGLADSRDGAVSGAETAADAQILVDLEAQQRLTYACGTLLVDYMRYILIAEELEGRKDGVGSRLTESAKGVFFDVMGELFELVQILERRLAGDNLFEYLLHSSRADTAGGALSAGLVNGKVKEELGYIDHAVAVVHDDKSARTHHAADGGEVVVVYLGVHEARGDASAGGSAGLSRLELSAVGDAAADVLDNFAQGRAHGDLNEAGVLDVAAECKDLGALGALSAHGGEALRAVQDYLRDVCKCLNVVLGSGLSEKTLFRRERRSRTGLAAVALDGGHERGLLAADECACTESYMKVEVEAAVEDVLAEQSELTRFVYCYLKSLDRYRVLRADIDIALGRAGGVAAYRHSFNDAVRVALEHGAIHECARVALVGVADDIFLIRLILAGEAPFQTRRESAAASAAQTGILDYLDDLVRGVFGQAFCKSLIAVHGYVFIDIFGVDNAAVAQRDSLLLFIELSLVEALDGVAGDGVIVEQMLDYSALDEVLVNYLRNVLDLYLAVERAFGINNDYRTQGAQTEAACPDDLDFVCETFFGDLLFKLGNYFCTVRRSTAGTAADKNV